MEVCPEKAISILIVGDQRLVCDCLSGMLAREPGFQVVGVAENTQEAVVKTLGLTPRLLLMDVDMSGLSCFNAIQIIKWRLPETGFLLIAARIHDYHLDEVLRLQVNGFVSKNVGVAELAEAVRNVAAGQTHSYLSPDVISRLGGRSNKANPEKPPKSRLSMLSKRELELLRLLAQGASVKEAAGMLSVSWKTADNQKASLMRKLDIHDRVLLTRYAIREGLVEP